MEITPNSNVEPIARTLVSRGKTRPLQSATNVAQFEQAEALDQALQATPNVRPEMVARARQYIGDVKYPPTEIIIRISVLLGIHLHNTTATDTASHDQA